MSDVVITLAAFLVLLAATLLHDDGIIFLPATIIFGCILLREVVAARSAARRDSIK